MGSHNGIDYFRGTKPKTLPLLVHDATSHGFFILGHPAAFVAAGTKPGYLAFIWSGVWLFSWSPSLNRGNPSPSPSWALLDPFPCVSTHGWFFSLGIGRCKDGFKKVIMLAPAEQQPDKWERNPMILRYQYLPPSNLFSLSAVPNPNTLFLAIQSGLDVEHLLWRQAEVTSAEMTFALLWTSLFRFVSFSVRSRSPRKEKT